MGEDIGSKDALHPEVATSESHIGWHSCMGMLSAEIDSMEFELEPFGGILSEADTTNGNDGREGSLSHSKMPTFLDFNNKDSVEHFGIRACNSVDSSALGACDAAEPQTCPDAHINRDTLTCREAGVSNNGVDIQINNGMSETKFQEAGAFSGMEDLDFMSQANIPFGLHSGKFRPKPKMKTRKDKPSTDISHPEVESVMHSQAPELVPSDTGYANVDSVPAFPADDLQDNSMRFDDFITLDTTSEISMNEDSINLAKISYSDCPVPRDILHSEDVPEILTELDSNCRRGEASTSSDLLQKGKRSATADEENNDDKSLRNLNNDGKSLRKLRKKVSFQLIDEPDGEANENGSFSSEPPTDSNIGEVEDGDDDDEYRVESDDEFRVESMSQKKRAPRKSKKSGVENGKPVQKRKRANEAADQLSKEPPKKFSHSTRRNRRCVDKVLLETPEDEIDPQRLPIKDLILLAEYKERLASKEAETSKTPLTNLRSYNSFPEESSYNGEAAFVSEQGRGSDDDQPSYEVPTNPFINYQSFMDKTPSTRWSKQDTELFYEAVRQFGTDFAMIQQLFPGRTRHQVKLKFKKEERQYPLRLSEALTSRAKDHSHFQLVIERLQQASQAEDAYVDDVVGRTGKEEEIVELTTQAKEEVAKPEQDGEVVVEDQEADLGEVHSPAKSDAGDDNLYDWSQYKSDY
ncbi:transcription factor TFIIIB component B'' isoform X3 [Juglans microcarpa x Juglans regia]|nr:transcription factor TFIIIB component B'' isoform X3 [Juglans microcarpa x Juglans regia]XP_041015923.1 transcription factor TFIIIB component B'' isoform X3 [Juglans microcarpa x Juglans regia]XP_041015924.1 transcription factor TFIIIB component B'' isoform X3 [Juglans microcarpa x Juglans regia]XP_041015926.1 transcription factor TFIIIB component B'' isoform X3 [Juglans microcarpa x Juglans regia]